MEVGTPRGLDRSNGIEHHLLVGVVAIHENDLGLGVVDDQTEGVVRGKGVDNGLDGSLAILEAGSRHGSRVVEDQDGVEGSSDHVRVLLASTLADFDLKEDRELRVDTTDDTVVQGSRGTMDALEVKFGEVGGLEILELGVVGAVAAASRGLGAKG